MKRTKNAPATLADMAILMEASFELDGAMTAEQFDAYWEYKGEQEAESAWLRHAESQGWEEALYESLVDSGLLSRSHYGGF